MVARTPIYNLKAVLKDTGLKPDVLRAWERRYGLPTPQRTPGGHRLYSDFDVAVLKWLIARQKEGLSISHAVELWREQSAGGSNPLDEAALTAHLPSSSLVQAGSTLDAIRAAWLAACLNFNEPAAEQSLGQAFSLFPVETVCLEVLQRGLSEIGELWYAGRASAQQEHFASALAMRRLEALLGAEPTPARTQTVLVGCPPDEWHTFMPLLIALLLRRRGLNVVYLGANVPIDQFEESLAAIRPQLVVLVAQQLTSAASLQQIALPLAARGMTVAFGGRIFTLQPGLLRAISGHFLGDRLDSAIQNIESLLESRPQFPQPVLPSKEHLETLKLFTINRPLIEMSLNENITKNYTGSLEFVETANHYLGDKISASLQLGSLDYLTSEIDWLNTLLRSHQMPTQLVRQYLETYAGAVRQHLGSQGSLIVNWINSQTS